MSASQPFDAVVLIAFGGPQCPTDILPFLRNVVRGRAVAAARIAEVARHYELFGGVSPITRITRQQASGLARRLATRGIDVPVFVGMRNWHPLLADTFLEMAHAGIRRAVGFIMAAHGSYSSCEQYRRNVIDARRALAARGVPDVAITYTGAWYAHEKFVAAHAQHVREAIGRLPGALRHAARLVFTAHSIPQAMADTCLYARQLTDSCALVARALNRPDWALVFQSRSGRPTDPWLVPDICAYLRTARAAGLQAAVLCPIGFVADHVEVLYDLDHEAAALCRDLHLPMTRAEALNDDPLFLDMMADVVQATCARYAGGLPLPLATPPRSADDRS